MTPSEAEAWLGVAIGAILVLVAAGFLAVLLYGMWKVMRGE